MKKSDYDKLSEWLNVGGGLTPHNDNAKELIEQSSRGEIIAFKEVTARDVNFHRCYFALLNYIYDYMPKKFKEVIPENRFYYFLKHLKGDYDVIFTFKDGSKMIEYESISFGKMSQKQFEEYIRNQLPWIYENLIGLYFKDDIYNEIVNTIEDEFKKFLSKL
jgi:hypothetical protein